ncbi:L-2-hydroxyglutarate oxidase [Ruixingdingia sedimenti]|uniref:L-2-hydroxyglutarate oxidase n=1 Tax=Ruixingdingia sedimenti TaxID=3073604 RepID=A0ABU1F9E1_9RHOB|nr:L-2-hydroxyglutarate oxidase [Xinfangfangia sp. LG-4]MDR5653502.1 L-2-hydroxyglutarate oxidase [Xinfangfangia sp. LG-4]
MNERNLIVIGGGIVGMATALRYLIRHPGHRVTLFEKETQVACHQSGHNSGVIHAGVYYAPGSLKARLCRTGAQMMKAFCREEGIVFEECGKLIVATTPLEVERLKDLRQRAEANGIPYEPVGKDEMAVREPLITGLGALFFPESAIVDYAEVTARMADRFRILGGDLRLGAAATAIRETDAGVSVTAGGVTLTADRLIVCGGGQADRLARLAELRPDFRVIPFRGEYFEVDPRLRAQINHLIYPVPDPALPFLGIHLTHEVRNRLSVGPNALLALSREGLGRWSVNLRDCLATFGYGGFWRFLRANLRSGFAELAATAWTPAYLRACRKYMPSLQRSDLQGRKAGVRAQLITPKGEMVHDFVLMQTPRMLHVCNAPSPAATSSLAIAEHLLDTFLPDTATQA